MTKNAETQAAAEMNNSLMTMIQLLEPLDEEEKERVLNAVYAFFDLRADPIFRISDVSAMVGKIAEVAAEMGPTLLNDWKNAQGASQPAAAVPHPPPPPPEADFFVAPDGTATGPAPVKPDTPQIDAAVAAIVFAMAMKKDPTMVALMFAHMLDYHRLFGGLPSEWAAYRADQAEEIVLFLAQQIPGMPTEYLETIVQELRDCLTDDEDNTTNTPAED